MAIVILLNHNGHTESHVHIISIYLPYYYKWECFSVPRSDVGTYSPPNWPCHALWMLAWFNFVSFLISVGVHHGISKPIQDMEHDFWIRNAVTHTHTRTKYCDGLDAILEVNNKILSLLGFEVGWIFTMLLDVSIPHRIHSYPVQFMFCSYILLYVTEDIFDEIVDEFR